MGPYVKRKYGDQDTMKNYIVFFYEADLVTTIKITRLNGQDM